MNKKAIRKPKGPATVFLIEAAMYFLSILSTMLTMQIFDKPNDMTPLGIIRILLFGATNLFMSIVLFSKRYNNLLLIGTGVLLIPSIFGLFLNLTPHLISEIIFYLTLFTFTYVMVKMPETPIREKAVKLRLIIPVFQFVLILISTIQTIQGVYEKYIETTGAYPDGAINVAIALLPSILGAVAGFLPVLCYAWLANWLADPYEK